MIVDVHAHAFPHQGGDAGYQDVDTHIKMQQSLIHKFWGRMISNTLDEKYQCMPDEEVGFQVGKYGRYYWHKHGKECWLQRFPEMMIEMEWPPEHLIAFMDTAGVDKAVLQAGYMEINFCRDYFTKCINRWPDRFIGTLTIDYNIEKDQKYREAELEKLREAVQVHGMRGLFQGYPREQPIDDPRFDPYWKAVRDLKIPHFFWTGFQPKAEYLEALERIERAMVRFPEVKAIIGHLGGNILPPEHPSYTNPPHDLLPVLRMPNVHFEVGYMLAYENRDLWGKNYEYPYPLHNELVKRLYHEIGAEKLLWGSDMPNNYRTCTYRQAIDLIRLHCDFMSEEEKGLVLGGNTARLFGLETG